MRSLSTWSHSGTVTVSRRRVAIWVTTILLLFGLATPQPGRSQSFMVREAGLDGGGGVGTAAGLVVTSSLGGSSPGGTVSSSRYVLFSGMPSPFVGSAAIIVTHDPQSGGGGVAEAGQDQTITARIVTNNAPIASATLHYRPGAATTPATVPMQEDGSGFVATIPGGAVNDGGLTYYFTVSDQEGTTVRAPQAGVYSLPIRLPTGIEKSDGQIGGTDAGAYRLLSMPITLENARPQDVLGDEIPTLVSAGAYDPSVARFFEPIGTRVAEFPTTGDFELGRAFWLIVRDAVESINSGSGTVGLLNEPVELELDAGWNFIGTPFTVPVPVGNIDAVGDTTFTLRSYGPGGYNTPNNPVTQLDPFAGYAVFVDSDTRLIINPPLPEAEQSKSELVARGVGSSPYRWHLQIRGTSGGARDADNVAAVRSGAADEWDAHDWPQPPSMDRDLSIVFAAPTGAPDGVSLSVDVRSVPTHGTTWPLTVEVAEPGTVRLAVDGIESVPTTFETWLVDEKTKATWNLRRSPEARLTALTAGGKRPMRLVVGTTSYVEEELQSLDALPLKYVLEPPYPNPSVSTAAVRVGLPQPERVTVEVYNMLGQRVARLRDGTSMPAGFHTIVWDAPRLASGLYFVRVRAGTFTATQKLVRIR